MFSAWSDCCTEMCQYQAMLRKKSRFLRICAFTCSIGADGGIRTHGACYCSNDFESFSLWPLRYICKSFIYWFLLYQNSGKNASAFLQNHEKVRKNSAKMGFFGEICPKYLTLYGKSNRIRITIVREFFLHEVFF